MEHHPLELGYPPSRHTYDATPSEPEETVAAICNRMMRQKQYESLPYLNDELRRKLTSGNPPNPTYTTSYMEDDFFQVNRSQESVGTINKVLCSGISASEELVRNNLPHSAEVVQQPSLNTVHISETIWGRGSIQPMVSASISSSLSRVSLVSSQQHLILPPTGRLATVASIKAPASISSYLASAFTGLSQLAPAPVVPFSIPISEGSWMPPLNNSNTHPQPPTSGIGYSDLDYSSGEGEGPYQRLLSKPLGYSSCLDPWNAASPFQGGPDFPDWRFECDIFTKAFKALDAPITNIDTTLATNVERVKQRAGLSVHGQPMLPYQNLPRQLAAPETYSRLPTQYTPTILRGNTTAQESKPRTPATGYVMGVRKRDGMSIRERRMAKQREGTRKSARRVKQK